MTADYERYAVYWAPEAGSALARFGAAWLGWDAEASADAPRLEIEGLPSPLEELTATPRRYGFHATLKPPFRLKAGTDRAGLEARLVALAADIAPFDVPALELSADLGFSSLRPSAPCPALDDLAARCVTELDDFRAPADEAELAKRRAAGLSAAQEQNLTTWGYPYVLGEFRFHVTLSGRIGAAQFSQLAAALGPHLGGTIGQTWRAREICLFGDPGAGQPFHLLRRLKLSE